MLLCAIVSQGVNIAQIQAAAVGDDTGARGLLMASSFCRC
jgi:hypothetical protein